MLGWGSGWCDPWGGVLVEGAGGAAGGVLGCRSGWCDPLKGGLVDCPPCIPPKLLRRILAGVAGGRWRGGVLVACPTYCPNSCGEFLNKSGLAVPSGGFVPPIPPCN